MKSRTTCKRCGARLVLAPTGRPKQFCSPACRAWFYKYGEQQLTVDDVIRDVDRDKRKGGKA
jgi:hypothetical protein